MKFSGFSFGLNVPSKANDVSKKRKKTANVFGASDEPQVERTPAEIMKERLAAMSAKSEAMMKSAEEQHAAQDPTANEYDGVWDQMKEKDERVQQQKRLKQSIRGKPKYVHKLIATAEKRQQQHDLWYQRKLQRELEADEAEYGETEKFVTPAYAKHLENLKKVKEEEERREAEEKKSRAKSNKGMGGFYSSLLQGNMTGEKVSDDQKTPTEEDAKQQDDHEEKAGESEKPKVAPKQRRVLIDDGEEPLPNALGVTIETEEDKKRKLEQLNESKVSSDMIAAARARALARRKAAVQAQTAAAAAAASDQDK